MLARIKRLENLAKKKALKQTSLQYKVSKMTKEERQDRINFLVKKAKTKGVPSHLMDRWEKIQNEYTFPN